MPDMQFKGRKVFRHEVENIVDKDNAKEVLDFLYGERGTQNDGYPDFIIENRYPDEPKENAIQRFNLLWVLPIFFVIIAPVRYVCFGSHQVSRDDKLGKVLSFLLGGGWK